MSLFKNLAKMPLGAVRWVAVPEGKSSNLVRRVSNASKYPAGMKLWKFSCQTFTAIGTGKLGQIVYLLRIERIK